MPHLKIEFTETRIYYREGPTNAHITAYVFVPDAKLAAVNSYFLSQKEKRAHNPEQDLYDFALSEKIGGKLDREDGPAKTQRYPDGTIYEEYRRDGKLHRTDGPAYLTHQPNGVVSSETYYHDGEEHRDEGPSSIVRNPTNGKITALVYRQHGKLHREDGPAWITYHPEGSVKSATHYNAGDPAHFRPGVTVTQSPDAAQPS